MAIFTLDQVNAWLDPTKALISALDAELTSSVEEQVLASLETRFDTSAWVSTATAPELVQQCAAMLYAGSIYRRAYSEDLIGTEDNYGEKLVKDASALLRGILDGLYELRDVTGYTNPDEPVFYPTDSSTSLYDTDPTNVGATPQAFTMNQVF